MTRKVPATSRGRCRAALDTLLAQLDDELAPHRCRSLAAHLDRCDCCGTLAGNLRKALAMCHAEGQRSLPRSVVQQARKNIRALLG
jgi:hypothetical protein